MPKLNGRQLIGILIIIVGIIALLNNLGFADISLFYLFNLVWPLLIAIIGINIIVNRQDFLAIIIGSLLIALGVLFFGRNAGFFNIDINLFWQGFWPIIIILIGLSILNKNRANKFGNLAILGGLESKNASWELKSGEYSAILGGIELDLHKATFSEKEVELKLFVFMGGINILIPRDVAVTCNGTTILGGIDLLGKETGGIFSSTDLVSGDIENASQIIHLDCTCIMGGIAIKH